MKKNLQLLSLLVFSAFGVAALHGQAPAGAPAGATGICKDGTYSMQAKKGGACRGHKGIQSWYAGTDTKPMTSTAGKPPAEHTPAAPMSAPQNHPATAPTAAPPNAMPASAPEPKGKRMSPEQAAASRPLAPGGGPGMVWANEDSKVYHCNGDPFYGRTKKGMYLSESDAKSKGFHGARGKSCVGK